MKGISPEVERLMWLIAEQHDPRAIADFEGRFPDLRYELSKRISMVNGLKSAGRKTPDREIPRFVPPRATPRAGANRPMYVIFACLLGAIAFGSYSIAIRQVGKPPPVQAVNLTDLGDTKPEVKFDPITPIVKTPTQPTAPPVIEPHRAPEDPLSKLIALRVENAPLKSAIAMVCSQAGVTYEIAPGMSEDAVSMDYQGESVLQILADLGAKHGFTAIPQESGKVLLIPVRPQGETAPAAAHLYDHLDPAENH